MGDFVPEVLVPKRKFVARLTMHEVIDGVHHERKTYQMKGVEPDLLGQVVHTIAAKVIEDEPRDWSCIVCGEPDAYETYVVRNELWAAAGFTPHQGVAHLACFEEKIGRQITESDLMTLDGSKELTMNRMLLHVLRSR